MTTRDPCESDLRWQAAADELAPHKSLQRIGANARAAVGTISVVATLLAGLGTFAATQITNNPGLVYAAAASVAFSTAATALSLSIFINRGEKVAISDLTAVERWYQKELKKARLAAWGGLSLIAAIVIAGGTAIAGLTLGASDHSIEAQMGVAASKKGNASQVHVSVRVIDAPEKGSVLVALKDDGKITWLNATVQPNNDGLAVLEQDLETSGYHPPMRLDVKVTEDSKVLKTFDLVNDQ